MKNVNFDQGSVEKHDLIYKIQRFSEENSPMIVYLPSKQLLFKMMRACFGCQTKEDLWINYFEH